MMIQRLPRFLLRALPLAGLVLGGTLASAQAQVFVRPFYYGGTWSGPIVAPVPDGPGRLPLDALFEEISDQGYRPLGVVSRSRETVVVDALDPRERRIRLTVDAFDGEILSRRAMTAAHSEPPRSPYIREVPGAEAPAPLPPRRKSEQQPRPAPSNPQALNPETKKQTAPQAPQGPAAPVAPVAPARDPSQWGKTG